MLETPQGHMSCHHLDPARKFTAKVMNLIHTESYFQVKSHPYILTQKKSFVCTGHKFNLGRGLGQTLCPS